MSDIEDHLDAPEGFFIDQYRVVRKLGTGTFGRVFLCASLEKHSAKTTTHASKAPALGNKQKQKLSRAERDRLDEEALAEAESAVK